jgi:hypothetical protein
MCCGARSGRGALLWSRAEVEVTLADRSQAGKLTANTREAVSRRTERAMRRIDGRRLKGAFTGRMKVDVWMATMAGRNRPAGTSRVQWSQDSGGRAKEDRAGGKGREKARKRLQTGGTRSCATQESRWVGISGPADPRQCWKASVIASTVQPGQ